MRLQRVSGTQSCSDFYITTPSKWSAEQSPEILAPVSCCGDFSPGYKELEKILWDIPNGTGIIWKEAKGD